MVTYWGLGDLLGALATYLKPQRPTGSLGDLLADLLAASAAYWKPRRLSLEVSESFSGDLPEARATYRQALRPVKGLGILPRTMAIWEPWQPTQRDQTVLSTCTNL